MKIGIHRICGVGDAVQMTPLLKQMHLDLPQAQITLFTSANASGVLEGYPGVLQLVVLDKQVVTPSPWDPFLIRMWLQIARHGPFDLFLHLGPRWIHAIGAVLVKAKNRAGLITRSNQKPHPFQTVVTFPTDPKQESRHASQVFLELWSKATGFQDRGLGPSLPQFKQSPLHHPPRDSKRDYLCFAPGAGNWLHPAENKRWPLQHWQRLIHLAGLANLDVILLGIEDDYPNATLPAHTTSLLGKTDLAQTASVLLGSRGFIGHDSGLFHMALGLHVPAVAFFGPTREDLTGPFRSPQSLVLRESLPCAPCCSAQCLLPGHEHSSAATHPTPCMSSLQPESVWEKVQTFLSRCQNDPSSLRELIAASSEAT